METEFFALQMSHDELEETYRSLVARHLMEGGLRRECGLEPADLPPLVLRLEQLLGLDEKRLQEIFLKIDSELWEHAWFSFTDEWAWFKARQEVLKKLGPAAEKTAKVDLEEMIGQCYQKNFERYVKQLDMRERPQAPVKKRHEKQIRPAKS